MKIKKELDGQKKLTLEHTKYMVGCCIMLLLLEMLLDEGGAGQSLAMLKKHHSMPTNEAILHTAQIYAALGYAEVYGADGQLARPGSSLNYERDYRITLTPAGRILAKALPRLSLAQDATKPRVHHNLQFWIGDDTTLKLLPALIAFVDRGKPFWDGTHDLLKPFSVGGDMHRRSLTWKELPPRHLDLPSAPSTMAKLALHEYAKAGLIAALPDGRIGTVFPITITDAGHKFGAAIATAKKMAFKWHPLNRWLCRRSLQEISDAHHMYGLRKTRSTPELIS